MCPGWSWTCCIAEDNIEFLILLSHLMNAGLSSTMSNLCGTRQWEICQFCLKYLKVNSCQHHTQMILCCSLFKTSTISYCLGRCSNNSLYLNTWFKYDANPSEAIPTDRRCLGSSATQRCAAKGGWVGWELKACLVYAFLMTFV